MKYQGDPPMTSMQLNGIGAISNEIVRTACLIVTAASIMVLPDVALAGPAFPGAGISISLTDQGGTISTTTLNSLSTGGLSGAVDNRSARATASLSSLGNASADASLRYFYEVDGPTAGINVPMFVSALLQDAASADIGASSHADAFFRLNNGLGVVFAPGVDADGAGPTTGTFGQTLSFNQISGVIGIVDLGVSLTVHSDGVGLAHASGLADPYIFIDPAFLATHPGYSVTVSEGVSNSPQAPEPAPFALFLLGLGCLAYMRVNRVRSQI
jgi:hypothetical protein